MQSIKQVTFNNRDGSTVLSKEEKKGLRLSHITNMAELDAAEQMNINQGLIWLETSSKSNYLSESFFKTLHKKLFGEVWRWAGTYRTSEKNIGVLPWQVAGEMYKFINDVNYWIENESFKKWPEFLAHFHHRLVYTHPFPNGNGRFSRIITNYLCRQSKKPIPNWHAELSPTKRRAKYINALRNADQKKYNDLILFFE